MGSSHGSIHVGGRRIISIDSMWCPEGRWMIVWDRNEVPFLRKVVCVLPPILQAAFPVYAYDASGDPGHECWTYAAPLPKGIDLSGLPGYHIMMADLKKEDQELLEEGELPPPPKKAPAPDPLPKKDYPLFAHADPSYPYALATKRIHALEAANKEKDEIIAQMEREAVAAGRVNLSLRLLAIHGLIYHLDSLIKEEMAKKYPNAGRIRRWSAKAGRLRISYETLKESKRKDG